MRSLLKTAAMVSGREERNEGVGLGVSTPKLPHGEGKGEEGAHPARPALPCSLLNTARSRNMKAPQVAAKKPRQ